MPKLRSVKLPASSKRPAHLFAALGDETRLHIVARLADQGPMSITRLTSGSRVTRQAVTKHLLVMESARLVHCRRHGRESLWQLDPQPLAEAQRYLAMISNQWDGTLARLQKFVETEEVS